MSAWSPDDNIDEDEEANDMTLTISGREGTIYLVDASLFSKVEEFRLCLRCIESSMLNKILTNHRDLVGVIFYNTAHSPAPSDIDNDPDLAVVVPENTAIFMPLKPLAKEPIKYFKNFKESDDFFDFENKYGHSQNSKFSEALWLCSRHFMHCAYKLINSTIYIFTNNEEPHSSVSAELQQTFMRAKDLCDNNVSVVLVPMVDEFNFEPFYKEFLCTVDDVDPDGLRLESPKDQRGYLLDRVYQRDYRKNCLRYVKFTLTDGLDIGCGIYSFTKATKIPTSIRMFRDTNEQIISKRCTLGQEFNEENETFEFTRLLLPGELFKCQEIAGKEIIFSCEELTSIQSLTPPGLRLLGFKPLELLSERFMIKHIAFLYPNESTIKGSTKLFRAMWQKCLVKRKFALCVLTYRRKVAPRYVALVPQTEETDQNDGFRVIYLPMETDISYLDCDDKKPAEVDDSTIELMRKVCRKLRFNYCPELFSDPRFQTFYSNMEALVYDEPGNTLDDTTLPDLDRQNKKLTEYIDQITEAFGSETFGLKRANADGAADGGRAKVARKELTHDEIEQAVRNGSDTLVTVANLKDYLKSKGKSFASSAKKNDLLELVRELL